MLESINVHKLVLSLLQNTKVLQFSQKVFKYWGLIILKQEILEISGRSLNGIFKRLVGHGLPILEMGKTHSQIEL